MDGIDEMVRDWDGLAVIHSFDPPAGARIFVAIHDTRLGQPVGGTRMKSYDGPEEALRDAMRLAEGMTWKWAGIGMSFGGGKCVIDVPSPPRGAERESFFRRYGRLLEAMSGAFATGVDLGTDPADMDVAARETRNVFGRRPEGEGTVDPGPYTAAGVYAGIRAALAHRFGDAGPDGRSVLVQGVGDVGEPLARLLADGGAELLLSDVDEERARELAAELGARFVAPAEVYDTECDVFAPCAIGGVLNDDTIPALRCAVVAGSANNQLAEARHAEALHERGVLYAPDYVVNAGGALAFGLMHAGTTDPEVLDVRVRGLGDRLAEIFEEADAAGASPAHAARRLAERTLKGAAQGS